MSVVIKMSEKRFRKLQGYMADNNRKYDNGDVYAMDFTEVEDMLNELYEENEQLKEELNNLKKDETMLYHYYTLARYGGD